MENRENMENANKELLDSKVNDLRCKVLDYVKENPDDIHPLDVELLKTNDLWITRFINFNKKSIDNAYSHLIQTFKQRNKNGIRSIDKSIMPLELWMFGTAYIYLPDREGCPVLYVRVENHVKPGGLYNDLFKKFLTILIDEADKLGNKEFGFNIFLDLCNIGWKNLDLDILNHIISTSRDQYPNGCKHFFIYGIPWMFNCILKSVVAALPSDSTRKIKMISGSHYDDSRFDELTSNFIERANSDKTQADTDLKRNRLPIEEFIDIENLPVYLGGKATLNCRIAPRNTLSIYKVGTSLFNYTDEETKHHLKSHQKFIADAIDCYKHFKDTDFKFEFDLENLTQALSKHIGL